MPDYLRQHALQIERVVGRTKPDAAHPRIEAEFLMGAGGAPLCRAYIEEGEEPKLQVRNTVLTLEMASAVAIAIDMALDWACEQTGRRKSMKVFSRLPERPAELSPHQAWEESQAVLKQASDAEIAKLLASKESA